MKLRVLQYGLGPIGVSTARLVAEKKSLELVAAVDNDPEKVGKDVGDLDGGDALGVTVMGDLQAAIRNAAPDVALHTTSSCLKLVMPQLVELISSGCFVVSSTEELLFPALNHSEMANEIDTLAKRHGVGWPRTGLRLMTEMTLPRVVS